MENENKQMKESTREKVREIDFIVDDIPLYGHTLNNSGTLNELLTTLMKIFNESPESEREKLVFANCCKHISFEATAILRKDPLFSKYEQMKKSEDKDAVLKLEADVVKQALESISKNENLKNTLPEMFATIIGAIYIMVAEHYSEAKKVINHYYIHKVWLDYNRRKETISLKIYQLPMRTSPKKFNFNVIMKHVNDLKKEKESRQKNGESIKDKKKPEPVKPFNGIRFKQ